MKFCPKNASNLPGTMNQHKLICSIVITFVILCAAGMSLELSLIVVGKMGVICIIILFGSPLAKLKEVIMTKSAKAIPLPFTLANITNCFLWSVFGLLESNDFNVYFPNMLGLLLALIQLLLRMIYGDGPPSLNNKETKVFV